MLHAHPHEASEMSKRTSCLTSGSSEQQTLTQETQLGPRKAGLILLTLFWGRLLFSSLREREAYLASPAPRDQLATM